jgi:hypothetical protein
VEIRLALQFEGREFRRTHHADLAAVPAWFFYPDRACAYDEATPPVVAVWQAEPANTTCTVNASNRTQFNCVLPPCLAKLSGSSFPAAA